MSQPFHAGSIQRIIPKVLARCGVLVLFAALGSPAANASHGKAVESVLREPLPPEDLRLNRNRSDFVVQGPTFTYHAAKSSALFPADLSVVRDRSEVISAPGPAGLFIDGSPLGLERSSSATTVVSNGKDKVVLIARGTFHGVRENDSLNYLIVETFFNDGVVVLEVKLTPTRDFEISKSIAWKVQAKGDFKSYLHKRRDEHGEAAVRGKLPDSGTVPFSTLTSCLGVVGPKAALAIFTDGGALHLSRTNLETAELAVSNDGVALSQYIVHVAPGDKPLVLKAGQEFSFRVGISVAPNRLPHPRTPELRMFIWIGDEKYPYPTDEEITKVAQWGYTMFQLHRAGTPGESRPPAGEFERVLRKVHELGMLYIWEENADLLYDSAPGVRGLKARGEWSKWQGFNYGGRYKATMDPYCDLAATCLASPNGLAEYRLANIDRMLDRYPVDGIYLDDNLGYANCPLWKEHGHPRPVYDCLIELHEMNWRRRELLRRRVPHAVLISHNTKAFVLPILADFDVQYFAEGYCFDSLQDYWDNYRAWSLAMNAQAMICPGDDEGVRCNASLACNYDLLCGGGQYSQMDWRLFPAKFHYAGGVTARELDYCKTYNLAEYYFGLSRAKPWYFARAAFSSSSPETYATIYQAPHEWLIPIANMSAKPQTTSLSFRTPKLLGFQADQRFLSFDIHHSRLSLFQGSDINEAFSQIAVPGQNLQLYSVRAVSADTPVHVWGGKRISEQWDSRGHKLTLKLKGPAGLRDRIFIFTAGYGVEKVSVGSHDAAFSLDAQQRMAHGLVEFGSTPVTVEVFCSSANRLPVEQAPPDFLGRGRN